jgi:hypothetical protein
VGCQKVAHFLCPGSDRDAGSLRAGPIVDRARLRRIYPVTLILPLPGHFNFLISPKSGWHRLSADFLPKPIFLVACTLKFTTSPIFTNHKFYKMSNMLTAYCMKTKEKNVPIQDAVITKTARGGYMAQGHDGKGNKMTTMLGEARALEAVKDGVAKKGW